MCVCARVHVYGHRSVPISRLLGRLLKEEPKVEGLKNPLPIRSFYYEFSIKL